MNICLFLPNWLGDVVMATPAIRAIRRRVGPQARIVGILRPNLSGALDGTGWLDETWCYHPGSDDPRWKTSSLVRRLKAEKWDAAVLFPNSWRSALVAWLARIPVRIGYGRHHRGKFLTHALAWEYSREQGWRVPMVQYYLRLAETLGCPAESPRLELRTTPDGESLADRVWEDLGLPGDGRVVAMHVGSAGASVKVWPAEYFEELARLIVRNTNHSVLLLCGPSERKIVRGMVRRIQDGRVVSLADQPLHISLLKSCIRRCGLCVSTDSGPRHVAAALGRPVVTLLGPTPEELIANPCVPGLNLRVPLSCAPCLRRTCKLGHHRCMRDMTPAWVFEQLAPFFLEHVSARAA
ncbi:lipopolysaccharide heptosyltransferase II [Thermopirellula anaerolimosa]